MFGIGAVVALATAVREFVPFHEIINIRRDNRKMLPLYNHTKISLYDRMIAPLAINTSYDRH